MSAPANAFSAVIRDEHGNDLTDVELSREDWERIVIGLKSVPLERGSEWQECRDLARDIERFVLRQLPALPA